MVDSKYVRACFNSLDWKISLKKARQTAKQVHRQVHSRAKKRLVATTTLMIALLSSLAGAAQAAGEVNVYSYREPQLIQPLFDAFTEQSGIKVNVVSAKKGLVERLQAEGINSPADLILTVDIGRLSDVKQAGLTQAVNLEAINDNIPKQYRDPEGHWFGLTTRARLIVASKDRVASDEIASYEDLADPKLLGRVCTRSGKHAYMVALTASMIVHHGADAAKDWLKGLRSNLARKPQGNDRAQVKAINSGECDVAVINSYYMGMMMSDPEQISWADSVNVIFPNQNDRGTHVNVSGMALTQGAPNKDNAVKLMQFLAGDEAQRIYAEQNHEYPVKTGVAWSDVVKSWGEFKSDDVFLNEVAKHRADASKLADVVDYDGS